MHTSTHVLESQLDWLTATTRDRRKARKLVKYAKNVEVVETVAGNRSRPFPLGNYVGYRCGRVGWGENVSGALVQLSGQLAQEHFFQICQISDAYTRLDIAVTVQTDTYAPDVGRTSYHQARAWRADHPRAAAATLVENTDGGSTCYVGKRSSDRYLRIYDKQAETIASQDAAAIDRYSKCWRYELELHDTAATAIRDALLRTENRARWIADYVAYHCRAHGIEPIFQSDQPPRLPHGFRRRSDRDSRLEWISRTVAPTIKWLLDTTPADELADRLGLGERKAQ